MSSASRKERDPIPRRKSGRLPWDKLAVAGSIASIIGLVSIFYSSQTKIGTWVESWFNFAPQNITINPSPPNNAREEAAQWIEVQLQKCDEEI
jgi:hypothetical protein